MTSFLIMEVGLERHRVCKDLRRKYLPEHLLVLGLSPRTETENSESSDQRRSF